jgi:hypothetical protein
MNRLLTLKAWKLIVAVVVIPFLFLITIEIAQVFYYAWQNGERIPNDGSFLDYALVAFWLVGIFCLPFFWQYQVGTKLTKKLANGRAYFDRKFRLAFFVPGTILVILILISVIHEIDGNGSSVSESRFQGMLFFLYLAMYLIGFYFRYRQMGKTLHWVDIASGHQPRGNAVNLLLSLFWWIGIWFLQPRVRAAWKGLQTRAMEDHFIE